MSTTLQTTHGAVAATTSVRISATTHGKLRALADQLGQSLGTTLDEAVKCYERDLFFRTLDAQYAALQADETTWQEYLREQEEWDVTLRDGLEGEPWETG
ncbi:toxin-antitoxin system protein [bacterium]|nr:toxin-antitoxin system protein [bacterium]